VPVANGVFGVDGQYDFVRATFASDGSNVPRMPPMRLGGGAYWRQGENWFVRMGLLHAFGQGDLGVNDTPTAGYNLLKMEIANTQWRTTPWGAAEIRTGLVGDNLLDVDVRNSVQFHKDEILMPGRSIKFFMNAKFGGVPPAGKLATDYYKASPDFGLPLFKAAAPAPWSWSGPYIGANIGYSFGKSRTDAVFNDPTVGALFATGSSDNLNGGIGGFQGGFNWQWGNWVAGIEADIQISGQGATPAYVCPGAICNPTIAGFDAPVTATFEQGYKLDSFGTLRGRFGTTITPDVMAYATGGLALGSIRSTVRLDGTGFDADGNPVLVSNTSTKLTLNKGWTVGAGLEARLFGNVTGKVEYLYMDFGTVSTAVANPFNATPLALTSSAHITDNIVRAGLNYKFNPALGPYDTGLGIGLPALAKALPLKAPAYAVPVEWTWAGPYVGANVGYAWGKSNTDTTISDALAGTPLVATSTSANLTGMTYGAQAGFNWQSGAFVAGIEADIQNSRQPGRVTNFGCAGATCNPAISAVGLDAPVTAQMEQRLEWFGTVRGRLGVTPTPGSLVYGTGGLAIGRIKTSGTIAGSSLTLTDDTIPGVDPDGNPIDIPVVIASADPAATTFFNQQTKLGWTAGAGAEVRLGGNWTGKVEYLYLDFGTVSTTATLATNSTPVAINFDSRVTEHLVRLGVNYKFDPFGTAYEAPVGASGPLVFKAPVRAPWTWAGFYLGGNIGYAWGKANTDTMFNDPVDASQLFATNSVNRLDGAVGGAQAGYNWVAGRLLAGIEADLNYSGQRAGFASTCPGEICNPALVGVVTDPSVLALSEQGQKLEWFATLRGRLGVTVTPDALAYVTGGVAVGEVMTAGTVFGFDGDGNPVNTIVTSHNTKVGLAAGGGIEGRLFDNWTAKIEYLYLDLGTVTTIPTPAPNSTIATAFNSRVTDNIVRVGVNYKFDPFDIWNY
jgi:opacity protein-like surface antigen